ncbi:MAG: 4'-phosphopantetheinyl transferase family protein [Candidatus Dormibacteraceae bacterium]
MIPSLVPAGVVTAEAPIDGSEGDLLPEERSLIANARERRRRELTAGRSCAHQVLARLGWPRSAVLAGPRREPLWPPGVVGSITHCEGYCAAAAGRLKDLGAIRGLGIDAEVSAPLPDDVARLVLTEREGQHPARRSDARWATAVFSAKEAVYKAWFPITGQWLDYLDAEIDLDLPGGRFTVRLRPSAPRRPDGRIEFQGRVATTATHVFAVATATLGAQPPPRP